MDRWLFIDDGPATGAENMARDEFLLARAEAVGGAPILRLYSFHPPAITIGYHQEIERALDLEAVRSDAVDVARRVTGGRALLHDGELTYCVVAPNAAIRGEARASGIFLGISRALSAALRSIGVDAEVARGARGGRPAGAAAPCLLSTTRYELAARGRKIAGSAQRTMRDAFLQHGSILLTPGSARIARYARGPQCSLAGRITSVSEELGREIPARELRSAVWDAFAETFRIDWAPFALSPGDEGEVRRMALAKGREFPDAAKREARCMVPAGEREFPDAAELDVRRAARAGEREFREVPEQEVRR